MIIDDSSPFSDLDAYTALPRLGGLRLSPDGRRLVVGVATPDRKKNRYVSALWEIDPDGGRPARRLTRSAAGESAAAFTAAGDLLFTSARPDPVAESADEPVAGLWLLPAGGGEPRLLTAPGGGVRGPVVAGPDGTVVTGASVLTSAADLDADRKLREGRRDAGVSAILYEEYPIRHWDHFIGADRTRLIALDLGADAAGQPVPRDLTGHAGRALGEEPAWDLSPDGRTLVALWVVAEPAGSQRTTLVAIDVATGTRRTLADDEDYEYDGPRISPDGTRVAVVAYRRSTATDPGDRKLMLVPLAGGPQRSLTEAWDRWPETIRWAPDGAAVFVTADDQGRCPLWRVGADSGEVTRLTDDDGAYTEFEVAPDGSAIYALRSAVDAPPAVVRVALDGGGVAELPGPAGRPVIPGRLTEVTATAEDGTPLRAWLALPSTATAADPAPLLLWIHGGPLASWNSWQWRWNPWLAVARGYAVLLPDPALSTGYGVAFIRRGWGSWGAAPYTDLMALTDAAEQRPDVDETRTAAMGGSFGGYMTNWIAGHTDRFTALVTHASLWALDQMWGTTDASFYWIREMTGEAVPANSPHLSADRITTPMLVIHGDRDYRVPIGEGLRLWWDLLSRSTAADGSSPHKFLFFPDENHWILKPAHTRVWYETVLAFLAHHVHKEPWSRPELLG
ncbi:peptidase S9 [Actinoplanes sp. SE50]|uniref:S9 family peptidase n=1 Tax=unclassified Actinoplanes TaxID=2626549 RepID=UPI00023ECF0D|nr:MULTISPECIES: prolyl oligopeptidase family serine peptidase [unclassified Actinoplanes]AEV86599.1 peptidase S9 prolyl oligopeptidase active site domain protein [Actinoplanes sp. SE50/110]ATO84997.1 peptidase S9 [Actinoplanes sp. SE50]SLM02406.1 peptidase S9 [Actinoplanes sp. SE50/110]